jgi:hypothetical protein
VDIALFVELGDSARRPIEINERLRQRVFTLKHSFAFFGIVGMVALMVGSAHATSPDISGLEASVVKQGGFCAPAGVIASSSDTHGLVSCQNNIWQTLPLSGLTDPANQEADAPAQWLNESFWQVTASGRRLLLLETAKVALPYSNFLEPIFVNAPTKDHRQGPFFEMLAAHLPNFGQNFNGSAMPAPDKIIVDVLYRYPAVALLQYKLLKADVIVPVGGAQSIRIKKGDLYFEVDIAVSAV